MQYIMDGLKYQPSCPCGAQVPLFCGLSCNRVLFPGGDIGVLLYSNLQLSWAYDDSLGLSLDERSKLSVISACSTRRSQFCTRKSGSVEQRPAMK